MLDQRNLAGIGNIYKTETLFLRRVSPWRPVGQVDELAELVELARQLLEANKDRIGQVTTADSGLAGRTGFTDGPVGRADGAARRYARPVRAPTWLNGLPTGARAASRTDSTRQHDEQARGLTRPVGAA